MSGQVLFAEVPSFYAAIEQARESERVERPVIVGGDPRKRGVVLSASRDALAAGVVLDMPVVDALRLCPQARAVRTDMPLYRQYSRRLFACLRHGRVGIEPLGLAGAYVDASGAGDVEAFAEALGVRVRGELGLPLRVGIARGKFLARVAAEQAGDEGVRRVARDAEAAFLRPLPVARLDGVGRKTAATLAEHGAHTIGGVVALGARQLEELFGPHGLRIFALASGGDDTVVRGSGHPQSLSRELTLRGGGADHVVLAEQLQVLARQLEEELGRQGLVASRVALKLRYADQGTQTRSQVLANALGSAGAIHEVALRLLERTQAASRTVRGLGLQVGRLAAPTEAGRQLDLFPTQD